MVGSSRLAIATCDRDVHGVLDWAVTALNLHSVTLPQFTAFRKHHAAAACKQYKMETVARVSKDPGKSTCLLWILDGYIKQNLMKNGGLLDEVIWIVRTDNTRDIAWLNSVLLPSEPVYYTSRIVEGEHFTEHYQSLDPDVYYVKLDDDTMYVGERAIDMMLHEKLRDRFFIVSANVINHSVLTWIHAGMGAMHTHKNDGGREILGNDYDDLLMTYLEDKPFANFTYGPLETCSLTSLECASLCHFYFLQNVANNQLDRYNFHFWDFHAFSYDRWSINAILFKGSDLATTPMDPEVGDEVTISWTLPEKLDRHCGAVGSALVVHLAYGLQRSAGIGETGIVQHYERLAEKLTGRLLPR